MPPNWENGVDVEQCKRFIIVVFYGDVWIFFFFISFIKMGKSDILNVHDSSRSSWLVFGRGWEESVYAVPVGIPVCLQHYLPIINIDFDARVFGLVYVYNIVMLVDE